MNTFTYFLLVLTLAAVTMFMAATVTVTTQTSKFVEAPVLSGDCSSTGNQPDPILCNGMEIGLYYICSNGIMFTCEVTGWKSFMWNMGHTGASGASGTSGTTGTSGNLGQTGGTGGVGGSGKTGGTGESGGTGTTGGVGGTGSPGSSGVSGQTGRTGGTGGTGQHGRIGSTGGVGTTGTTGTTGVSGTSGVTGASGATGGMGPTGAQALSITCPPTFVGFVTQIPTIGLTGNATTFVKNPCPNVTLSYTDSAPPVAQYKRQEEFQIPEIVFTSGDPIQTSVPMNGHLGGVFLENFTDTGPIPGFSPESRKRSVTFPTDWTQQVGNYSAAFMMNTTGSILLQGRMGFPSLETDQYGVYRYFTHLGMGMNQVVQHDYYSMFSNLHVFNPGQVFLPNSSCYIGNTWTQNTTHYQRKMRYDILTDRVFIIYTPTTISDVARRLCVVVSNSSNVFYGGAYGYEVPLPFNISGPNRMDVGILNNSIQVCMDGVNEPFAPYTGMDTTYTVAARFGNCFIIRKSNITTASLVVPICATSVPGLQDSISNNVYQNATASPLHVTKKGPVQNYNDLFYNNFVFQLGINNQVRVNGFCRQSSFPIVPVTTCYIDFDTCTSGGGYGTNSLNSPSIYDGNWNISSASTIVQNGVSVDIGYLSVQVHYYGFIPVATATVNTAPGKTPSIMVFSFFSANLQGMIGTGSGNQMYFGGSPTIVLGSETFSPPNVVIAYHQFSTNTSNQIPSTYFSYRLSTDPTGQYRTPKYNVQMNGLINPQQISLINGTNLISTGIAPRPGKMEFTMMGMGNSYAPGIYDMIHDDFRIQGEHFVRTFTLSDACNSTSCTQDIYLNSTQSLILQCPETYYGTIFDGNGTSLPVSVSGNATWSYLGYTCGNVSMTFSDGTPPVAQFKREAKFEPSFIPNTNGETIQTSIPMNGHLDGVFLPNFTDTGPILGFDATSSAGGGKKRSVTFPTDWTQQVGNYTAAFMMNTTGTSVLPNRMGFPSLETDSDGVYRYFTHIGLPMSQVVQHDYYNMFSNLHIFNPGQVFLPNSSCYIGNNWGTNTSHYPRKMRYDVLSNRFFIVYIPLNATLDIATNLCVVVSNNTNVFYGGAYGYNIPLPFNASGPNRMDVGILNNSLQVCFDAVNEPFAPSFFIVGPYSNAARFGNCFVIQKSNLLVANLSAPICSVAAPGIRANRNYYQNSSAVPMHLTTNTGLFNDISYNNVIFQLGVSFETQINSFCRSSGLNCFINMNTCTSTGGSLAYYLGAPDTFSGWNISSSVSFSKNGVEIDIGYLAIQVYWKGEDGVGTTVVNTNGINSPSIMTFTSFDESARSLITLPNTVLYGASPTLIYDAGTVVVAYNQFSTNASSQIPSTYFSYRLSTDPFGQYRTPKYNVQMNGLTNPQQISLINGTNLISTGIAPRPGKMEFTIMGMGTSAVPGVFSMIHNDFRVQGETVTRTFTLSDGCGSTSCSQQIFLNSTQSLILQCPETYYGTILTGNGTFVPVNVSGNATWSYLGYTCGSVSMSFVDTLPPTVPLTGKRQIEEEPLMTVTYKEETMPSGSGTYMGMDENYVDLLETEPVAKRSVSWNTDWTQKVGNFPSPIVVNTSYPSGYTWVSSLETDGTLRYVVLSTNNSFAVLQTDYYNIQGNAHLFNPASSAIFPPGTNCFVNGSNWPTQLKRDINLNRYVFSYFNPANASILCLVMSNTNDFFNGGGYGYQVNLPYIFGSNQRFDFGINDIYYTFCFDDLTRPVVQPSDLVFKALQYGNCFVLNGTTIITMNTIINSCAMNINAINTGYTNTSGTPFSPSYFINRTLSSDGLSLPSVSQRYTCTPILGECFQLEQTLAGRNFTSISSCISTNVFYFPYSTVYMNRSSVVFPKTPTNMFIPTTNGINTVDPGLNKISLDVRRVANSGPFVFGFSTFFTYAYTVYNGTENAYIVYGIPTVNQRTDFKTFNPNPGTYLTGLNVFAPNIKFLFDGSIVMSYLQTSYLGGYPVTSTGYAYALATDPTMTLRPMKAGLTLNGLTNPQQLTFTNMTNPIVAGLAVVPNLYEFSIFGPGNAQSGSWSFVNQDFRIQSESFQRTFTLADGCGSTSCVQQIYLNSTRSLILTCPATYVGSITDGNGTYVSPSISGNATTYIGSPCGTPLLTFTTENPPSFIQATRNTDSLIQETFYDTSNLTSTPGVGHVMGQMDHFSDLPIPEMIHEANKRSVTFPTDWTQKVGSFGSTYSINTTNLASNFTWLGTTVTDGIIRYAVYNTAQSLTLLQHDYYNIAGNVHFFNPGEGFPANSNCNPVDNQTGWVHSMIRDQNRFVFAYFNPANYSTMCLTISNTNDFFNGGAVFYAFDLPSNISYRVRNFKIGRVADTYNFCFENTLASIPTSFDNCFAVERGPILLSTASRICKLPSTYTTELITIKSPFHFPDSYNLTNRSTMVLYRVDFVPYAVQQESTINFNFALCSSSTMTLLQYSLFPPIMPSTTQTAILLPGGANSGDNFISVDKLATAPVFGFIACAMTDVNATRNTRIIWSYFGQSLSFSAYFDPRPGNYSSGLHVFAPNIRLLPNGAGVVMSYQQVTGNPAYSVPSTSYAYWLVTDPPGRMRVPSDPLLFNGLTNPQTLTAISGTNPVQAGLDVLTGKNEFTIFGPGNAQGGSWSFINQDFRIQGERYTRTFTLTDGCGSTSCVQEIYLNSTRSLILTCPATYVGSITDGNGTYVSPSVSGTATSYVGNPCGTPVLTFTTENPPSFVQPTRKRDNISPFGNTGESETITTGTPVTGHLMGSVDVFTDLDTKQMSSRSVTSPLDWTQQVGNFPTTYNITSTYSTGFTWLSALDTDGVLRYAVYNTNQSFAVLQHDYYNLLGNAHFFNPGQVFTSGNCNVNGSVVGWVHDLKQDVALNRFVFTYFNPANYSVLCLVISNTNDFFNGGGYGYEISLPYTVVSVARYQFAVYGSYYQFCFDDYTQNVAQNANATYNGALYWGNCFYLNRLSIINAIPTTLICPFQFNQLLITPTFTAIIQSVTPLHQRYVNNKCDSGVSHAVWLATPVPTNGTIGFFRVSTIDGRTNGTFNNCSYNVISPYLSAGAATPIPSSTPISTSNVPIRNSSIVADAGLNLMSFECYNTTSSVASIVYAVPIGNSGSTNTTIAWGLFLGSVKPYNTFTIPGVHVFAPNIKLMKNPSNNVISIILAYQQSSANTSLTMPSTSYAYWTMNDPNGVLRVAPSTETFNGLSNTQVLTATNRTNPIRAGLIVHPTLNEFSIFGPGNAQVGSWSFINQDFRIQGERFTRTFTLTDGCGSTSCVQELYLNSTRSLILTCPATYYGTVYQGNGTYLSPTVTGTATTYVGNPCGNATLTFTTENPPINVQEFTKRQEDRQEGGVFEQIANPITAHLGIPMTGHMDGSIGVFTDLPLPPMTENQTASSAGKRSVTWARDWTQQVGNFGSTYNVTYPSGSNYNWVSAIDTNGVYRYVVYNTNQSFALLQHDYNDISGNAHFFNPGQVFNASSLCSVNTSSNTYIHDIKWDLTINRFVFVYFSENPGANFSLCLVISNTENFFSGGASGYVIPLNYTNFIRPTRLTFSVNRELYSFCFDDFGQNLTKNSDSSYVGPLFWGNCFVLERAVIIAGLTNPKLCPLQLNAYITGFPILSYSVRTATQTSFYTTGLGSVTGLAPINIFVFTFPGGRVYYFGKNGALGTWDWNLPCDIFFGNQRQLSTSNPNITSLNTNTVSVPVFGNGLSAAVVGSVFSVDRQDGSINEIGAIAWNIIDPTGTSNTKIGVSIIGKFNQTITFSSPPPFFDFTITFDPFPGNYTHGVHVFNPTIRVLSNKSGIVLAYQQSTLNPNLSIPSTSYAYWLNSDPIRQFRFADYPLYMNNLANPQRLTGYNMTNPVNTGLAIPPNFLGFSIYGPGDATGPGPDSWSFINQNFEIMGERWTRTFTLADQCGSTSCVQEIYLNNSVFKFI